MCYSCAAIRWVPSWVFSVVSVRSYRSSNRNEFTWGLWWAILALGVSDLGISVFLLKSLFLDPFCDYYEVAVLLIHFSWWTMILWKDNFLIFQHSASIMISLICCYEHRNDSLPLDVELMRSLVFDRIWIDDVELYFYGHVDVDLVHSGGERYWQSLCWQ